MDTRSRSIRVLMLPWLAHGHISPFLHLAKSLANHNFITYICSSQVNLNSIKKHVSPKDSISIKLVELPIPPTPDLPPHLHTTNALPPHLMNPLKKAFHSARPAFSTILRTLNPDLVVYDFLQSWAPEEAAACGVPAVLFYPTGAVSTSFIMHRVFDPSSEYPFPAIHYRENEYSVFKRLFDGDDGDVDRIRDCVRRSCDVVLIKSFKEMEGKYVDFLSHLTGKRFVPVGPLIDESDVQSDRFTEWLDRKEAGSTVFASFGSEYFLSENELEEIAYGLEMAGVNFIWVVRFPMGEGEDIKIEERLPLGFLERVGERGMVVEGWAPQRKILAHKSVGGFLSHCGWSSVMEAVYYGVPIAALPMHLDQPLNARVVVEGGLGEEVVRSGEGKLDRVEVVRVVEEVVLGSRVRRRVAEMMERMRERWEREMDGVVGEMVRLCWMREKMDMERENSVKRLDCMIDKSYREQMMSENT